MTCHWSCFSLRRENKLFSFSYQAQGHAKEIQKALKAPQGACFLKNHGTAPALGSHSQNQTPHTAIPHRPQELCASVLWFLKCCPLLWGSRHGAGHRPAALRPGWEPLLGQREPLSQILLTLSTLPRSQYHQQELSTTLCIRTSKPCPRSWDGHRPPAPLFSHKVGSAVLSSGYRLRSLHGKGDDFINLSHLWQRPALGRDKAVSDSRHVPGLLEPLCWALTPLQCWMAVAGTASQLAERMERSLQAAVMTKFPFTIHLSFIFQI